MPASAFTAGAVSGGAIGAGNSFSSGEQLTYVTAPGLTFNVRASTSIPTDYTLRETRLPTTSCSARSTPTATGRRSATARSAHAAWAVHRPEGHLPHHRTGRRRPDRRRHLLRHRRQPVCHPARRDPRRHPAYTYSCGSRSCTATHNPEPDPHQPAVERTAGVQEIDPAPIIGLTDGYTYKVDSASTGSSIKLDPSGGGSAIGISRQEVDNRLGGRRHRSPSSAATSLRQPAAVPGRDRAERARRVDRRALHRPVRLAARRPELAVRAGRNLAAPAEPAAR